MKHVKVVTVSLDWILSNITILMRMKDYQKEIVLDAYARMLDYKLDDKDIEDYAKECISWQYDGCDTVESLSKPLLAFKAQMLKDKQRKG